MLRASGIGLIEPLYFFIPADSSFYEEIGVDPNDEEKGELCCWIEPLLLVFDSGWARVSSIYFKSTSSISINLASLVDLIYRIIFSTRHLTSDKILGSALLQFLYRRSIRSIFATRS